jgi:hypothetical protein
VEYATDVKQHRYANESRYLKRVFLKTYGISAEDFAVLYKKDPFRVHFERLQNRWLTQAFGIILSPNGNHDLLFEVFAERHPAIRYGPEFLLKYCVPLTAISSHLLYDHFVPRIDKERISPILVNRMIQLGTPATIIVGLVHARKWPTPRISYF